MQSFENIQADKNNYAENSFHDDSLKSVLLYKNNLKRS